MTNKKNKPFSLDASPDQGKTATVLMEQKMFLYSDNFSEEFSLSFFCRPGKQIPSFQL
jgi:hypothetical protein